VSDLLARMRTAVADARLRPLELALAEWCRRHGGAEPVALAMAHAARALADGHSCLALDGEGLALPGEGVFCDADALETSLRHSALVGGAGDGRPLVLDAGRLYLHRYWVYETRLAERLRERIAQPPEDVATAPLGPEGGLFDYGWMAPGETNWQALAAFCARRQRLAVISGGPGTGKTYTVRRLMRLLVDAAREAEAPPPRIRLTAPTGKAAARMMESIREGLEALPDGGELAEHLPREATTLHRLLGLGGYSTQPAFDRTRPLPVDAVIVDEASMVDLPLMAKLADAVPVRARLVLLGDRYQLASVESGSVLAELCGAAGTNVFSPAMRASAAELLGDDAPCAGDAGALADHVITLQTSHRFRPDSPIGRLAAAVNDGDADAALSAARSEDAQPSVTHVRDAGDDARAALVDTLANAYASLLAAETPEAALATLEAVRLLTATRVGPDGGEAMNDLIHRRLAARHGLDPERRWYHGRPVIVLRNDYRAGLFNGDTGVCLRDGDGHLRVWFRTAEGPRPLLPTALPEHETVYAMTVHKSQGSEFEDVWLLLPPDAELKLVTRELIYTGITRARERLTLQCTEAVLRAGLTRTIRRDSGLAERL